ncbi:sugar phosphate isomerase/epimerase [Adhaeribacter arboris]|uniref:Sugar phosphate isomerase/epimerase n=1 Tax=Adhaeribacter arboris TaxID=2072846 RepID=A0A2T2YJ22_9BACT|nr:sugar phosphate isomerase/epimerase [Adhaeribacter arboris]PSR55501.1 sugar phosphate isomerase/epimerase [Adhaeribacter arboris]
MINRRDFLKQAGSLTLGAAALPLLAQAGSLAKPKSAGIQLYTVRKELEADVKGTLKKLATIGYKELESARSAKGNYYGFAPKEFKKVIQDLGMNLRSGHVHLDKDWQKTVADAAETGQTYLICSSLPTEGQTISNYQKVAEQFNKAGEECKKAGLQFGYHNHEYEFEKAEGKVLYDLLLAETDPKLVAWELDLGWVVATGHDPIDYFTRYPRRFPLWHLKDMKKNEPVSTEFGKGGLDIAKLFQNADKSGLKYYFVEQEEYSGDPIESVKHNFNYLQKLKA